MRYPCSRPGCSRPSDARGLCKSHYNSQRQGKGFCTVAGCPEPPVSKYDGYCTTHRYEARAKLRKLAQQTLGREMVERVKILMSEGIVDDEVCRDIAARYDEVMERAGDLYD